jgi:prepilin-type N-terminal cleavage/methylation domain-containing protein
MIDRSAERPAAGSPPDPRTARPAPRVDAGFTLLELLVALGLLVFGATTLIGALTVGVDTRRGTEMRARAVLLADQVLHHVEQDLLDAQPIPADWRTAEELQLPTEEVEVVDGFPGMRYAVSFRTSPERPDLCLATVRVAWRDQGEDAGQVFQRLLPRARPLARRVESRRNPR